MPENIDQRLNVAARHINSPQGAVNLIALADAQLADETNTRAEIVKVVADNLLMLNGTFPCVSAALAIGSSKPQVATGLHAYQIAGMRYSKAAVAAGTAFTSSTHDVADGSENTFLLSIQTGGTITITIGTAGTDGAGSAGAIASVPSGECAIGLVTISAATAIFNATTDDLDAAHLTVAYTNYTFDSNLSGETAQSSGSPTALTVSS